MKYAQTFLTMAIISLFSHDAGAVLREISAQWEYPKIESISGFRLYQEGNLICSTDNPQSTSLSCTIDTEDGQTWFTLTAVFADGNESPHSEPLTYIFSSELLAKINADPKDGESPLTVSFDGSSSTGNISTHEWIFGDGESAFGRTISHTYIAAGNYIATLRVSDGTGAFDHENITILVTSPTAQNNPPVAVISSSATVGRAPLPVDFDGSDSSDSDGTILGFSWEFGDGAKASGPQSKHTYVSSGTFSASLTVTDDGGASNSVSTPVLVQPPPGTNIVPTAMITASASSGKVPLSIRFDGGKSMDTDGSIVEYSWNFGDGSLASGQTVSHTFLKPASYKVELRVTDNLGAVSLPAMIAIDAQDISGVGPPETDAGVKAAIQSAIRFLLKNKDAEKKEQKETK